jgi:hypothetical protein
VIEFSADLDYLLEAGECDRVMVLDESGQHDAMWFYPEQTVYDLRQLARDLYALLTAPVPYMPVEVAERMAARDYVERRMSELGLEVDE